MLSRTYKTDVEMKLNIEVREISANVKFHDDDDGGGNDWGRNDGTNCRDGDDGFLRS